MPSKYPFSKTSNPRSPLPPPPRLHHHHLLLPICLQNQNHHPRFHILLLHRVTTKKHLLPFLSLQSNVLRIYHYQPHRLSTLHLFPLFHELALSLMPHSHLHNRIASNKGPSRRGIPNPFLILLHLHLHDRRSILTLRVPNVPNVQLLLPHLKVAARAATPLPL